MASTPNQISIPPGVVRGATPSQSAGRWYDANQIIWRDGVMQPLPGWSRVTQFPLGSTPRKLHIHLSNDNIPYWFAGCDEKLYVMEGSVLTDITPVGFSGQSTMNLPDGFGVGGFGDEDYGTPRSQGTVEFLRSMNWSLNAFGEATIASASTDGRLYWWSPDNPTAQATVLSNAPTGIRASIVAAQSRQVMVAGVTTHPRRIAWSDVENPNEWMWDTTLLSDDPGATPQTTTAGWLDLEADGLLLGLYEVAEGILCIAESDCWLLRYQGGPYYWGRQRVATATSILSPHTVATFQGKAAWMTKSGFALYEAGNVRVLPSDVSYYVAATMDPLYGPLTAHGAATGEREIIWFYPSKGSTKPDSYVIWSHAENWWSIGKLDRTAFVNAGAHLYPVASDSAGHIYQHNDGTTAAGASRIGDVWAETGVISGNGQVAIMRGMLDSGTNVESTTVQVLSRQTHDGAEIVGPTRTPRADGYTPMRDGGRDLRIRIEAHTDDLWSIGKPTFELTQTGNR